MKFPAGASGAGVPLSSAALDNLLLCVTVEGSKTETLAVSSFPKVHDFCKPFTTQEWNALQGWYLEYQPPCVSQVPGA